MLSRLSRLTSAALTRNPSDSEKGQQYGEHAIVCDRAKSLDLGKQFPAEGLLRALVFETDRPIKYGANIGQSVQTLRLQKRPVLEFLRQAVQAHRHGEVAPKLLTSG